MRKALDFYCGAGWATRGMQMAGFHVTGVDIKPQPRYCGDAFIQADALSVSLDGYDFVWSSPPCQAHTVLKKMWNAKPHVDLIPQTRAKLKAWGGPWIIENVVGAPLFSPVLLCGTMFNLGAGEAELRRHRLFESNCFLLGPECQHRLSRVVGVYGGHGRDRRRRPKSVGVYGHSGGASRQGQEFSVTERREAMGIDWMMGTELSQAIPPAYSQFLCQQILEQLERRAA